MTPDPLTPPTTGHAEPASGGAGPPASVRLACQLVVGSLVIGVLTVLTGMRPASPDDEPVPVLFTVGILLVFGGLTVWLAAKTHQGQNWARWALLAYLMLGWWLASSELNDQFMRAPIVGIIDAACIGMEVLACWRLFTGPGAAWFAALAARDRSRPPR